MRSRRKQNTPVTIDGSGLDIVPTPRINLSSLEDIRREGCRVYREIRSGKIPSSDGTRLIYVLDRIAHMIEMGQLETRLAALEAKVEED